MKFLVFTDRPYYPYVEGEYDDLETALAAYKKEIAEEHDPDAEHESKVYLSVQIEATDIRTSY